jgi:hypothetical protein
VTALTRPMAFGERRFPPLALLVLAAIGAVLLLVVAFYRWDTPSDEHAYWLAARRLADGLPLYDSTATSITPYAYWYPPIVAQVLVPFAVVLPEMLFTAGWTVLMLGCLWWLAGRNLFVALALVAFPPIAVEFWFRNIHLILAVLIVLAIRSRPAWFSIGAAIKISPGLGIAYLLAQRRWRPALVAAGFGVGLLAASILLSPEAWRDFLGIMLSRGPGDVSGFLAVPYIARAIVGLGLAVFAARLPKGIGDVLLVVAIVVALPTLWFTALSTLMAVVPLWRSTRTTNA